MISSFASEISCTIQLSPYSSVIHHPTTPTLYPSTILICSENSSPNIINLKLSFLASPVFKMDLLVFLLLLFVTTVTAAPTESGGISRTFKNELLIPLMEEMCLQASGALCDGEDGHKPRYGVYDPYERDGPCACADSPSEYIVGG